MDALSRVVFMGRIECHDCFGPRRIRKSCRLKKKSVTRSAQNAAKSLIGEAWSKYRSTIPTVGIVPISSIPGPRRCKLARSERERRVPLRHALSHYSDPEEGIMNTSSVTSQNLADAQW
jgi:hypothetical protein